MDFKQIEQRMKEKSLKLDMDKNVPHNCYDDDVIQWVSEHITIDMMEKMSHSFCIPCSEEDESMEDLTLFIDYGFHPFTDEYMDKEDINRIGVYYCAECETWAVDDDW